MSKVLKVVKLVWKYAKLSVSTSDAVKVVQELDNNKDGKITLLELIDYIISNIIK